MHVRFSIDCGTYYRSESGRISGYISEHIVEIVTAEGRRYVRDTADVLTWWEETDSRNIYSIAHLEGTI